MKYKLFLCVFIYTSIVNVTHLRSQEEIFITPEVNVISVTPIQGSGVTLDRMPSNIQTVGEEDLRDNRNMSVTEQLNKKTAGVSS